MKIDYCSYYLGMALQALIVYYWHNIQSQLLSAVIFFVIAILIAIVRSIKNV